MAKGYMIANLYVRDKEGFEKFREMAKPVFEEYGGKVLLRTPNAELEKGKRQAQLLFLNLKA